MNIDCIISLHHDQYGWYIVHSVAIFYVRAPDFSTGCQLLDLVFDTILCDISELYATFFGTVQSAMAAV